MDADQTTKRRLLCSAKAAAWVLLTMTALLMHADDKPLPPQNPADGQAEESLGSPISFEPNQGQADDAVKFMARGPGYTLYLTHEGVRFSFERSESYPGSESHASLTVKFVGANAVPQLAARDELPTRSSYFLGSDPKKWRTRIPNYARVMIENVYPGTDVTYRGTHGRLQCHFLVSPGTDSTRIRLEIAGADSPRLDAEGDLILRSGKAELRLYKPTAHQDVGALEHLVSVQYVVRKGRITFAVGDYDRTKPLAIDPVLNYGAYLTAQDAERTPHFARHH
jgi:hypothetical protein